MNTTESEIEVPQASVVFTPTDIIYITIACIGIVDNLIVVTVMGASRVLRSRKTNILIINQSVIDLVASMMILLNTVIVKDPDDLSGFWGELYCRVWISRMVLWSAIVASTYNLFGITFERYVAVVYPLRYHISFSSRKARILCLTSWIFGIVFNVAFTIPTSRVVDGHCYDYEFYASEAWRRVNGAAIFFVELLFPMIVFAVSYGHMVYVLRRSVITRRSQCSLNRTETSMSRAKRNTMKTMTSVVIAYVLCHTANQCVFFAHSLGYEVDFLGAFYNATVIAAFANCCISPFIYTLQYEQFQKELKRLLCARCATEDIGDSRTTTSGYGTTRNQYTLQTLAYNG